MSEHQQDRAVGSDEYVAVPLADLEALQNAVVMGKPGYAAARHLAGQARPIPAEPADWERKHALVTAREQAYRRLYEHASAQRDELADLIRTLDEAPRRASGAEERYVLNPNMSDVIDTPRSARGETP